MQDRIEKVVELAAPVARVWRALTDRKQFGEWFRVNLDTPFVVGQMACGKTTYPGFEGMKWEATVVAMEHERLFAFKWCPYEHDDNRNHSPAPQTLVEFRLEATPKGTRLLISESGFDKLPDDPRRVDVMRTNEQGWSLQSCSLAAYVES